MRQQFKNSPSDKTEWSISKHQQLNLHDDKEEQGFDKYESEGEDERYVTFLFIAPSPPPQRESNRLTDLGKGTRSLIISYTYWKSATQRSANFVLEFPGKKGSKLQKKNLY